MKNITQTQLKKLLHYNLLTGIFIWKINPRYDIKKGGIAGTNKDGYIIIKIKGKQYRAHRLAWLWVKGYFPEGLVEHKNQIKHHNWWSNLRLVSTQCNARNCGNPINNTSGVKGVYWNKKVNKWQAYIKINQINKTLGVHKKFHNAVCARLAAEQCVEWSGCDDNSPSYQYVQRMLKSDPQ